MAARRGRRNLLTKNMARVVSKAAGKVRNEGLDFATSLGSRHRTHQQPTRSLEWWEEQERKRSK